MSRCNTVAASAFATIVVAGWSVLACDDNCKEIQAWLSIPLNKCLVHMREVNGEFTGDVSCFWVNPTWVKNGTDVDCDQHDPQVFLDVFSCAPSSCTDECPQINENREHLPPADITTECEDTGNNKLKYVCAGR